MASPQKENGYAPIANEILMALARLNLSPYEARVMWIIFSKTYGNYGKKMDRISLSQFSNWTEIARRNVRRTIASLLARKVITSSPNGNGVSYGLQKDHALWKPKGVSPETVSPETPVSAETLEGVSPEMPKVVSPETPTEDKARKARVRGKPPRSKNSDPRVKEFMDWWHQEYRKRFSSPYRFNGGKEGTLIKVLLQDYDLPRLQELARLFFDSTDPWVQQTGGYTIGVFASQINKIVSTARSNQTGRQPKELAE